MDKNVLKKFAIESRQELMDKVSNKIKKFYIDEEFKVSQNGDVCVLSNEKHTLSLTKKEYKNRQLLIKRINEITLEQVIEEAAYTWFNRIIAIRYMEIHDYLPLTKDNQSLGIRVLSSKDNTPDPEIMKISNLINPELDIEFNKEYYGAIQDNNKRFEYILLLICRKLGKVIPQVFDGITDYIDILIPDNLLNDSGYINKVLKDVPEDNFEKVEIIGWLYQYYISEKKDIIFNDIKKNIKVEKNNIPAATQLFTPDWIVKYLVDNSLGRYWMENNNDYSLLKYLNFYIESQNEINTLKTINPTELTFLDPCCGSGHILVYAFEVFVNIYKSLGYNITLIPELILNNNIYGIDIDFRAAQLSILSILLKAREYDKFIFSKKISKNLNIVSVEESNSITESVISLITDEKMKTIATTLIKEFNNAKEYGSLLKINSENISDYLMLVNYLNKEDSIYYIELKEKFIYLVKLAQILSSKYDIVVTNPPYMGKKSLNNTINKYIEKNYEIGKSELYSAFIIACNDFTKENGLQAMITIHTWMFISSFKNLRKYIIENLQIENMIHLGPATFEDLNSFNVLATAFILRNKCNINHIGTYVKLDNYLSTKEKINNFYNSNNTYNINQQVLSFIQDTPIVYWISNKMRDIFKNESKLEEFAEPRVGLQTGENNKFVRNWYEINYTEIGFNYDNCEQTHDGQYKWFPYNNGGNYRKWYGNNEAVVDWYNNGQNIKADKLYKLSIGKCLESNSKPKNTQYYFLPGITWSIFGFSNFGVRIKEKGFIFDVSGSSGFPDEENTLYILAFLASKVSFAFLSVLAPTVNFQTGNIADLPLKFTSNEVLKNNIERCALENIEISKSDWDNFEFSWNFKKHPLIKETNLIENAYKEVEKEWMYNFNKQILNEEEINSAFIKIYELENELTPQVEEKDITIRKANKEREIKSLLSYAVGCIFGRYSLDKDGLIYAGGNLNQNNYQKLKIDKDNIIPIVNDNNYFGDDIVTKIKDFIEIVYGKETLYNNLDYIADALGKKSGESSEETIRRYFINSFYEDHLKIYQKKPIYWLFDSGKKNGFKCLVYIHRYNESIVSKMRLDYLHKMQNTYEKELLEITEKLSQDISLTEKKELSKIQADLNSKLQETKEYDEKVAHIADKKICINLDDGISANYEKFSVKNPKTGKEESILAKIK